MTPLGDTLQLLVADLRNRLTADLSSDEVHLAAAMAWLVRAQVASENKGVSAGFHLLRGWAPPYPETTGYIIPTFLSVRDAGLRSGVSSARLGNG
jgi:hypothetical protein